MLVIALLAYTTTVSARIYVGPGQKVSFKAGHSVVGASITLYNRDGSAGRTWYECYMPHAKRSGYVIGEGVIDPNPAEVASVRPCSQTRPNPGPRFVTGPSTFQVEAGHRVVAAVIEFVGGRGRTFFGCKLIALPQSARVTDGVVDPHPLELEAAKSCQSTVSNPGRRVVADGKLNFQKGDRLVASYIRYSDGSEFRNCFIFEAKMSGFLTGGVRNYYPGEETNLPVCK